MHSLSARWIPAHERGKFMVSYHGLAIGSALNYPLGGLLITSLGWEYVFYFTGGLSVVWSCAWWFLVHDSPAQHPHITTYEREYLEQSLGKSVEQKKV
ncbi:unnamed protein product [Timema podura]|uniref:Major facilitator superfamily (MFS) profile domain-containing protein n=1 Tax=Timema podura TaxID=61482 RepID=A0ABN7PQV5_TIMPD|nr:unnamed protein product [Timema podura]